MATVISLFNHKGGVSKTTTAFNLGWMIARKGKKVLLVDCDPQCNLTGMVLGLENMETAESILGTKNGRPLNIREGLAPAFESRPSLIQPVDCPQVPGNGNLWLLPGHIGLAEYEVTLGIAQELSGSLVTLRNLPGSLRYLIDQTAQSYGIDVVLVDMSPSLGAVNQNLFATSDFFLVPMHPDYFSTMAIKSLTGVLPKWNTWANSAAQVQTLREAEYPYPQCNPKFLGYVIQKYRPRNGAPSNAFQSWIDQLTLAIKEIFIPAMKTNNLMLTPAIYQAAGYDPSQPILQMPDFNSLIARSQQHQTPIFELTPDQLDQAGSVLANTQKSQTEFRTLFEDAANKTIRVIDAVGA
jgi:cellulose biosynthesis protein BcsQ